MSGYTIIDADTHVTETPDLWTSRAPARCATACRSSRPIRAASSDGGSAMAVLWRSVGMTATAGRGTFKHPPKNYEGMHPGAYDAKARLKYMDEMGIWAMVMYPNVGGFGAQQFLKLNDPELMLTCVQIYNDWQTEWASADSRRLLPITSIPFWDVDAAVEEVRRCAEKGHQGNSLHRRAAILRQAAARRPALESAMGGRGRVRLADQLSHRFRRHAGGPREGAR